MKRLSVAACAGFLSGTLVLGLGARILMRAILLMDPLKRGEITSVGAIVGDVTFSGTMQLVFTGSVMGLVGGIAWWALEPALPQRHAPAIFSLLAIGSAGWALLDRDNADFHRFGAPIVNVILFGALLVAFCAALIAIERRLDAMLSIRARWILAPVAILALFVSAVGAFLMMADHPGIALLLGALAAIAALARWQPAHARRALLAPAAGSALVLAWALAGILARA